MITPGDTKAAMASPEALMAGRSLLHCSSHTGVGSPHRPLPPLTAPSPPVSPLEKVVKLRKPQGGRVELRAPALQVSGICKLSTTLRPQREQHYCQLTAHWPLHQSSTTIHHSCLWLPKLSPSSHSLLITKAA